MQRRQKARRLPGRIVERVVDELEGDAEILAVAVERRLFGLGPVGDDRADAAGGGEERGRLGRDDLEIGVLGGLGIVRGLELHDLALGDHRGRVGEDAQDVEAAVLDHELERAAEQEIADQHARRHRRATGSRYE